MADLSRECAPTTTQDDESISDVVYTVTEFIVNPNVVDLYVKANKDLKNCSGMNVQDALVF